MKLASILMGLAVLGMCAVPMDVQAHGGGGGGGGGGHGGGGGGHGGGFGGGHGGYGGGYGHGGYGGYGGYGGGYGGYGYGGYGGYGLGGYGLGLGLGYGLGGYGYGLGYGYPYAYGGYGGGYGSYGGGYGGGYGYPYNYYPSYNPNMQLPSVPVPLTPYYDPNQPQVPPMPPAATVKLEVLVPDAQARVWVDGQLTTTTGKDRNYITTPLDKGSTYAYTVRASWTSGGHTVTAERQINVTPGQSLKLDFSNIPVQVGSAEPVSTK